MKKVIVTIWYFIMSFDGVERIEGPTPDVFPVFVDKNDTPWQIKKFAAETWEQEHELAVIENVEIGNTSGIVWKSDETCRMLGREDKPEICPDCPHNEVCTVGDQF